MTDAVSHAAMIAALNYEIHTWKGGGGDTGVENQGDHIAALIFARDTLSSLSALFERALSTFPAPASPWRPIETAPKDGTKIDVWVQWNEGGGKGISYWRVPDVRWNGTRWVRMITDGDYAGEDDEIEWSVLTHVAPAARHRWATEMDRSSKITHWMPLPAPPSASDGGK